MQKTAEHTEFEGEHVVKFKLRILIPWLSGTLIQVLGDHVMRQHLVEFVHYEYGGHFFGIPSSMYLLWSIALIVIPLLLVMPFGVWISSKLNRNTLIVRATLLGECLAITGFVLALWSRNVVLASIMLLFKGAGSAMFAVLKFPCLVQSEELQEREYLKLNGWFEGISLIAIFIGTCLGVLWDGPDKNILFTVIYAVILLVSVVLRELGLRFISHTSKSQSATTYTERFLEPLRERESRFLSALGVGWFWFVGATFFALSPFYARQLMADMSTSMVVVFGAFASGLLCGLWTCLRLARDKIELGLVPFASLGLSISCLVLWIVGVPDQQFSDLSHAMTSVGFYGFTLQLFALAFFGGIFLIPLQSFLHATTRHDNLASIVAGTNWLSVMMMSVAVGCVIVALNMGVELSSIVLGVALMNFLVFGIVYQKLPRFVWAFMVWVVTRVVYQFKMTGREHIPEEGAAVISCNHPSYIDFMFVAAAFSHRPPRFIMHHTYFNKPVVGWLFRDLDVIPIAPKSEDEDVMLQAFDEIARALEEGELVCIFPEGLVTYDGKLNAFRPGIERIIERTPVPVIPLALRGLWGSSFGRAKKESAARKSFKRFRAPVELRVGEIIPAEGFHARELGMKTAQLGGFEAPPEVNSKQDKEMQKLTKNQ